MTVKVNAVLPDRRSVELAVEHLVQEYGLDRKAITIQPVGAENTVGERAAGADAESGYPGLSANAGDAAVEGALRVSLEMESDEADDVEKVFRDAGATDVKVAGS